MATTKKSKRTAKAAKKATAKKRATTSARSAKASPPPKARAKAAKSAKKPAAKRAGARAKTAPAKPKSRAAATASVIETSEQGGEDSGLRALIERAAPEIIVRLGEADAPIGDLAALVLVDNDDELRVRVDNAAAVATFVANQMPDARELRTSLSRRLDGAIHCLIVVERGADEADVTYVALEIEARTAN